MVWVPAEADEACILIGYVPAPRVAGTFSVYEVLKEPLPVSAVVAAVTPDGNPSTESVTSSTGPLT